jgi:hypothetical protein
MESFASVFVFMIPIVGSVALFMFLAVNSWAEQRRKERESYYRYEFRKTLVEAGKMDANDVRSLMQYEEESTTARLRQSSIMAGFILLGVGVGMLYGLSWIDEGIWRVGYIPLGIGVGIMVYALLFAPRLNPTPPKSFGPRDPSSDA